MFQYAGNEDQVLITFIIIIIIQVRLWEVGIGAGGEKRGREGERRGRGGREEGERRGRGGGEEGERRGRGGGEEGERRERSGRGVLIYFSPSCSFFFFVIVLSLSV